MYSKISAATASIQKSRFEDYENLKFADILCVVCQSILKEPIFLPCDHGYCLNCFDLSVQKNELNCPCCRKRFATWLRKSTLGSNRNLVDQKLWKAIQTQFGSQLNVDDEDEGERSLEDESPGFFTPPETFAPINEAGEIRKEFETQLQQYQKELIEKENKETLASKNYIIDLYRQENVINLADSSSENQSQSAISSSNSTSSGGSSYSSPQISEPNSNAMLLAQPSTSYYKPPLPARQETSSIISISSSSSPASTSVASSRYSLIKSVTEQINKGTEIIKQTVQNSFLGRLTKARLKEHEKSNENLMTVKPTKVHRAPSKCSSDGNDSLKNDTNYFKPIVPTPARIMPRPLLRIPSVKLDFSKNAYTDDLRPSKSPHQLLSPVTLKQSAFCIVNQELATEYAEQLKPAAATKTEQPQKRRGRKRKVTETENESVPQKVVRVTRRSTNFNNNSGESNSPESDTKQTQRILDNIVFDQKKYEAMLEQERRDFEYAKKLQNIWNRQRSPRYTTTATTCKYGLRRKVELQNVGDCRSAVQEVERIGIRRSARNKC